MSERTTKRITPAGKMSNLVGMVAWISVDGRLHERLLVAGKADDDLYIVQDINTGWSRLVYLRDMVGWVFISKDSDAEYFRNWQSYFKEDENGWIIFDSVKAWPAHVLRANAQEAKS